MPYYERPFAVVSPTMRSTFIIIIIIQEKIYVAFSPSELQGHVTMSKS